MFNFLTKLYDECFNRSNSTTFKMLAMRILGSIIIAVTVAFHYFEVKIDWTSNFTINYDYLMAYFPNEYELGVWLVVLPLILIVLSIYFKARFTYTNKSTFKMYYFVSSVYEFIWSVSYLCIAILSYVRCSLMLDITPSDKFLFGFGIVYLGLYFLIKLHNDTVSVADRVMREDKCISPFCDSDSVQLKDGDHVYYNGLEYRLVKVRGLQAPRTFTWILSPCHISSINEYKEYNMYDVLKEKPTNLHKKID